MWFFRHVACVCLLRLLAGIAGPLGELKKFNKELIDMQAAAMVTAPQRQVCK